MNNLKINPTLPIHVQLVEQLKYYVEAGIWQPGIRLPTVRGLAHTLQINYNTVRSAYQELERQGYITTTQGRGTFVAQDALSLRDNQQETLHDLIDEALLRAQTLGIPADVFARTAFTRAQLFTLPADPIRLLFVECNVPDLDYHATTIQQQTGIRPETYVIEDLRQQEANFFTQFDFIMTVFSHVAELQEIVGSQQTVLGLMVEPSYAAVLTDLAVLPPETPVGLICKTQHHARFMERMLIGLGISHVRYLVVGVDQPDELESVFAQSNHLYVSRQGLSLRPNSWPGEKVVHEYITHLDTAALRLLRRQIAQLRGEKSSVGKASRHDEDAQPDYHGTEVEKTNERE